MSQRKRSKFQLSLRTWMTLSATVAVLLSLVGAQVSRVRQARRAIAAIEAMGGHVTLDSKTLSERIWAERLERIGLGDYYDRVRFVAFHGAEERRWTLEELEQYGQDATPQQLSRWSHWTIDNVLALQQPLTQLSHLKAISFSRTRVPRGGLHIVSQLHQLERLDLSSTGTVGRDLRYLSNLSKLQLLAIHKNPIRDEDLIHLKSLPHLVYLNIGWTEVGDAALKQLAELTHLEMLHLENTGVTDEGIQWLGQCQTLRQLDLGQTEATDKSVETLSSLTKLEDLTVGYLVTPAGLRQLEERLPACRIRRNSRSREGVRSQEPEA